MKALSIMQPWAGLILLGNKSIETRIWKTSYRGKLVIHASRTIDNIALDRFQIALSRMTISERAFCLETGKLLGEVDLFYCREWIPEDEAKSLCRGTGLYSWVMKNPVIWEKALEARGFLGLFDPQITQITQIGMEI